MCRLVPKKQHMPLVAGVADVAMGIKLSPQENISVFPKESVSWAERLRAAFLIPFSGMINGLRRIFLPHLLALMVLWMMGGVGLYKSLLPQEGSLSLVGFMFWGAGLVVYAIFCLGYSVFLSFIYGIGAAAGEVEDFFYELFASVKEKVSSQIESMEEGLPKQQAKMILNNSVLAVFAPLRELRFNNVSKPAALLLVSVLSFVTRCVFLARLARLTTQTVHFSAVFASRATLVGALFLNLRWLSIVVLWFFYAVAGVIFILNLYWVC